MLLLLVACTSGPSSEPPEDDTAEPAVEGCNGVDDDGDGVVDEGLLYTFHPDADADGFGADTEVSACAPPAGHVLVGGDCDDADPAVHPDATEACGTAADDDCDGAANEAGAEGCTETWGDADGDGLGDGVSACVCEVGDRHLDATDCDGTDVDRGLDCAEGAEVPLAGARVRDDDDGAWILVGAADVDGLAGPALVLEERRGELALLAPPEGDTTLSATLQATLPLSPYSLRALGTLGDAAPALVEASYVAEPDEGDPWGEFYTATPTLRALTGTLLGAEAWSWELAPVYTSSFAQTLLTADLDGDGRAEAWYSFGTHGPYWGESVIWRADDAGATLLSNVDELHQLARVGDTDGDGLAELGLHVEDRDGHSLRIHPGPITDTLPTPDATLTSAGFLDAVGLGDLDGDGYDDLALRGERVHVFLGPVVDAAEADAHARIGSEVDDVAESALFVTAGDVGADGTRDLVVTDTYWPSRLGSDALRGAVYTFHAVPSGVVDVRGADTRVYGEGFGAFGAYPQVLDDGRLLTAAHLLDHADGMGVFYVLEGL